MKTPTWPSAYAAVLVALLVSVAVPIAANHSQAESGRTVAFDHKTGNEWWVEVTMAGPDAATITKVEGMDTGGAWTSLPKQNWGAYAASFHIEPGHQVRFRAVWSDGDVVNSCWFTHPAGVEQCSTTTSTTTTTTSSTTTTTGSGFDATFTGFRGNEWWVQANVATNGPAIAKVDVTLDGGQTFKPLTKQSWGGWAASYHITQGTIVQMRATASGGQTDLSSCRQWIPASGQDATIVACGSGQPPPSGVTFSNVKGNEHWAEVVIKADKPIYGAFLIMDCDPNRDPEDMTYRADWGKWTLGNRFIPSGTRVTFYAFGEGVEGVSGGYIWPQATPTAGCPPPPNWYKDGSYAEYALYNQVCGGGSCDDTHATLSMTLRVPPEPYAPYWDATCSGTITHTAPDGTRTTQTFSGQSPTSPPDMTRTPRVGYQVDWSTYLSLPSTMMGATQACLTDDGADWRVTATGQVTKTMRLLGADGQPRTMTVWNAQNDGNVDGEDRVIQWETNVGLVLHWENTGRQSGTAHFGGDLVRTNAPI